ncbi:hypothetical protein GCM10010124_28930 [Pilimelia terevasa]|uniref:Uncharacterized protein n=1 Tax=Pilimelia terevasa TaxID=53372 RepID=A0A8J3BNQ1_9ACTN|nr:hypothetical protein GCM10010124_28930 [Pilimelia terevasa]
MTWLILNGTLCEPEATALCPPGRTRRGAARTGPVQPRPARAGGGRRPDPVVFATVDSALRPARPRETLERRSDP